MMSALMFLIGFICGHCFSQRWRRPSGKKDDQSPSSLTNEPREDLELKDNVAYIITINFVQDCTSIDIPTFESIVTAAERYELL